MLINERHAEFSLLPDPAPAEAGDILLIFRDSEVLLRAAADANRLPLYGEIASAFTDCAPRHLFTQSGRRFFSADAAAPAPAGFAFESVRAFRQMCPEEDAALLIAAYHLAVWYRRHRFCGACGGPTRAMEAERALECVDCGLIVFPTIQPAVIVAITDGDKLLLARNAQGAFRLFTLIAGYVEVGETAEQAVLREALEEVGLRLKNIRYIASQAWGFSQSLMLGFTAELDGSPEITLQENELAEARWFTREDMPRHDSSVSISFELMERFRDGRIGG